MSIIPLSTPCLKLESSNAFFMANFHILTNKMDYAVRVKKKSPEVIYIYIYNFLIFFLEKIITTFGHSF
jgi:hypothetical protein